MSVLRYCSTTVLTAATMIVQSKVLTSLEDKMWGGCDRPGCPYGTSPGKDMQECTHSYRLYDFRSVFSSVAHCG